MKKRQKGRKIKVWLAEKGKWEAKKILFYRKDFGKLFKLGMMARISRSV